MLGYLGFNAAFVIGLVLAYVFVTRRRARIHLLVDHLASSAREGRPFQAGLRMMGKDLGGWMGLGLERVARRLEEGRTLGEAFEAEPGLLPPLLRGTIVLGDRSGNLASFLEEARRSYRRVAELPNESVYFFIYPVVLSIAVNLALAWLLEFVMPRIEEVFLQVRLPSPYGTWAPILSAANVAVLVLSVAFAVFLFTGGLSAHFAWRIFSLDGLALRVPVAGRIARDASLRQFCMGAGLLVRAGAGLPASLRAAAEAERNAVLRRGYEELALKTAEGARLSEAARKLLPDDLLWFVETGEASGSLGDHLLQAGFHYDTKVRLASRLATRAVVPVFIILNGGLVLGACLLTWLPVRDLIGGIVPW